eukprot:2219774-Rhodomonas_salina.1
MRVKRSFEGIDHRLRKGTPMGWCVSRLDPACVRRGCAVLKQGARGPGGQRPSASSLRSDLLYLALSAFL